MEALSDFCNLVMVTPMGGEAESQPYGDAGVTAQTPRRPIISSRVGAHHPRGSGEFEWPIESDTGGAGQSLQPDLNPTALQPLAPSMDNQILAVLADMYAAQISVGQSLDAITMKLDLCNTKLDQMYQCWDARATSIDDCLDKHAT